MTDRIATGFDPFVIPFVAGMIWVLSYCLYGIIKILAQLPSEDRRRFFLSLITPRTAWKNIKDIFLNCLIHVKLWRRNPALGYMHSSIAFGWFMLIVLGHIEVFLFIPGRIRFFYYPIFFNYFVAGAGSTIQGAFLFFLMDLFLLVVLSGILCAIIKRVRSRIFGLRRTTRPSFVDMIGLYSLWAIFPLRLLAEGFTAHISGGSFLIIPLNWLFRQFLGNNMNMLPTWWAYSCVLGVFMFVLPFSRYMHIPTEMLLIPMRNAGLKIRSRRRGFARVETYSCPGCGVCIDACPMSVKKANIKDCTVYLNRQIRRGNEARIEQISDKCLLCGKCEQVCQVGCEGHTLRIAERAARQYAFSPDFALVGAPGTVQKQAAGNSGGGDLSGKGGRCDSVTGGGNVSSGMPGGGKVLYFSGCMTALTPRISRAMTSILEKAGIPYEWMDRDGGICCGRPMLTAGRFGAAKELIRRNEEIIMASGADTLLLTCPICYKIFSEHYKLPGVRVIHHSEFIGELIRDGRLLVEGDSTRICYHDPCELGRGSGIYEQPREILTRSGHLVEAGHSRAESICCGGSLGSLSLGFKDREAITRASLADLCVADPDIIATACPLCLSTFSRYADRPVLDLAEILDKRSSPALAPQNQGN